MFNSLRPFLARNTVFNILLLLLFLVPISTHAQKNFFSIVGTIVDEDGKPVPHAIVAFESPYRGGIDHIIPVIEASEDGSFSYTEMARQDPNFSVYSQEENIDKFWTPVDVWGLRHSGLRRFQGIAVKRRGRIDLGNIPLIFDYEKVVIDLGKLFKLGETQFSLSELKNVTIKCRYENKRSFPTTHIHERALRKKFLDISLQKGRWILSFAFQNGRKNIKEDILVDVGKEITVSYPN